MNKNTNNTLRYGIYLLLALSLFTPLIVANSMFFPFITGKAFFFRIVVEIAFGLWVILAFRDKSSRPTISPLFIGVTLFTIVALFTDVTGVNLIRSLWSNFERMEGWVTIIHLWAYFVVMISVLKDRIKWQAFFNVSFVAATIVAIYGIFQFFHQAQIHQSADRLDASLGNAEYLAVYMLIHCFLALYMSVVYWIKKQARAWAYLGLAFIYGLIIFGTQTRGTMLAVIGGLFLTVLIFAVKKDNHATHETAHIQTKNMRMIAGGILIVLVLAAGGFYSIRNSHFVQSHGALSRLGSISLENPRIQYIWPMAWEGFKEKPILGWGQENFNYVFNKYYNPAMYAQEQWFDRAHNVFIDWAIAGGIVGFGFYVALFVLSAMAVWKSKISVTEKSVLMSLLAAYAVHNMFVFDNIASYILFFVVMAFLHTIYISTNNAGHSEKAKGVLARWSEKIANKAVDPEITNWVVAPIVGIVIVSAFFFTDYRPIHANYLLIDSLGNCQGIGQPGYPAPDASYFARALDVNTYVANQEIREQLYSCSQQVMTSGNVPDVTKISFYQLVSTAAQDQAKATPNDLRGFLFSGTLFDAIGQWSVARPYLDRAYQISPVKQSVLIELGSNDFNVGSTTEGLVLLKKAYDEAPSYSLAENSYARGLYLTHDYVDALPLMKELASTTPGDFQTRASLAAVYLGVHDTASAISELNTVAKLNPEASTTVAAFITAIRAGKNPFNASSTPNQ